MQFLLILVAAIIFTIICRNQIRKIPWLFYIVSIILSLIYFTSRLYGVPAFVGAPKTLLVATMQKGSLGTALFVIVMYIGVFRHGGKARSLLNPIRGELSIIAWLLVMGHVVVYGISYLPKMFGGVSFKGNVMFSLVCGLILFVLLIILGVTSINAVRKALGTKRWKRVQKWAYLFYALTYGHIVAILAPSAVAGAAAARTSIIIYTVIFGLYAVARIHRGLADRNAGAAAALSVASPVQDATLTNINDA